DDRVELDVVILQRGIRELEVQPEVLVDLLPGRVLVDRSRRRIDAVGQEGRFVALLADGPICRLDQVLREGQIPGGHDAVGARREIRLWTLERDVRREARAHGYRRGWCCRRGASRRGGRRASRRKRRDDVAASGAQKVAP